MTDSVFSELVTFTNSQGIACRGMLLNLSKSHVVFEVYNPYSVVQLSEVLSDLKINYSKGEIYNGKAIVTNIVNTGVLLIVSATLSESNWKSILDVTSRDQIKKEVKDLITRSKLRHGIDAEFRLSVLEIRALLLDIKNWMDKIEPELESAKINVTAEYILDYFEDYFEVLKLFFDHFAKVSDRIIENSKHSKLKDGLAEEDFHYYKSFVQNHLHQLKLSAPFPHRMYTKPLGYAGDYEMMNMIQRENAEGPNLYAKFMNVLYTNIPIANSVKNRTALLTKMIKEGVKKAEDGGYDFHSFSIACGPALEVRNFIRDNNPKTDCHFKLLDFNSETLGFAKSNIDAVNKKEKKCHLTTQLDSVHVLLKKSVNREVEEQQYDLVYCSGLFDYLSDKICSKLTKMFYSLLKPGGKVLVTNMRSENSDHHMLELCFEWYLIYRDKDVMAEFAPNLGRQRLFTDSTGVNLCLEITKL